MIDLFGEMVTYPFMVRAIVVGLFVSLCASLLGVSLVLKRYSMIGEGLSNVGFGALSVALAFNLAPLKVSIPIVVLAAFLLLKINENSKIKGDAAIAIISTGSLAGGVLLVSKTTGMSLDVCNFMFGSILAMSKNDVKLSIILSVMVLILFILFYNKIFAVTFDETFATATGTKSNFYNMLIAMLTAITIVLGMRMMGALLISSLIIFPALSSMRLFKQFRSVIISSACISVICFLLGLALSYKEKTPTGASVVVVNLVVFMIFFVLGKLRNSRLAKTVPLAIICILLVGCADNGNYNVQKTPLPPAQKQKEKEFETSERKPQQEQKPEEKQKPEDNTEKPSEKNKDAQTEKEQTTENPKNEKTDKKQETQNKTETKKDSKKSSFENEQNIPKGNIPADPKVKKPSADANEVVITENFFITQINDIFYNIDDYKGKTIVVEGMFSMFPNANGELVIPTVFRFGPGCCSNDGWGGFMLNYNGPFPEAEEWIEVKGTPYIQEDDLFINLYLDVTSFKVKKERGAEYVDS